MQQVEAIVRLADWDLQYSRNALALDGYEQAYAFLKAAGAQAAIDALFSPPLPFVLPTFDPNPLGAGAGDEAAGYIDVAFTITKVGAPRRINRRCHVERNRSRKKGPRSPDQSQLLSSARGPRRARRFTGSGAVLLELIRETSTKARRRRVGVSI